MMVFRFFYFNPRSLAGATAVSVRHSRAFSISIHAPSRERLASITSLILNLDFNPRSLAGATGNLRLTISSLSDFNPRSLAGATLPCADVEAELAISIHAPSRERPTGSRLILILIYFNPRSLAGATEIGVVPGTEYEISIHAPSRERPLYSPGKSPTREFQSTLPRGSDPVGVQAVFCEVDFNPRSLAGATNYICQFTHTRRFQSTLPRGSDDDFKTFSMFFPDFNPRSLAGATMLSMLMFMLVPVFQSTLPRGSDVYPRSCMRREAGISIHAPSRERR